MTDKPSKHSPQKYLSNVKEQYESYPFPLRDPADERRRLHISECEYLPRINHYLFGGRRDFRRGMRVLVAGGGTGDATIFLAEQLRDCNAQLVYLDMSESSLQIAKQRAKIRGLENIEWVNASILDLSALGLGRFDYISCTGVLHHLADPAEGLEALQGALSDEGGMCLMVYGKYGRRDIYMIRDLVRLVRTDEPDLGARVHGLKSLLRSLPRRHPFFRGQDPTNWYAGLDDDDANLFDAFLHEQDRPYSVPEIYEWLNECGLNLVSFTNFQTKTPIYRMQYEPAFHIENPDLLKTILKRPVVEQQAIAEIMDCNMGLHTFYASRRRSTAANLEPDMVPFYSYTDVPEFASSAVKESRGKFTIDIWTGKTAEYVYNQFTLPVLSAIDGTRTCEQIIEAVDIGADQNDLMNELRRLFNFFNSLDWMLLRDIDLPRPAPLPLYRAA